MSEMIRVQLANGEDACRTITVEDLCALHLPRYPLVNGVLSPSERRAIQITRDAPFKGIGSVGSGCIRLFYEDGSSRTLTLSEGDAVQL